MKDGGSTLRALTISCSTFCSRASARASTLALLVSASCATPAPRAVPTYPAIPSSGSSSDQPHANDDSLRLGGRLFDNPWKELRLAFVADDPKTEAIDGKGGPFDNGSLPDENGKPMPNTGHGYRLKNLLGWDLHGAAGISGKAYRNEAYVLLPDLAKNTDARDAWIKRLSTGEDAIPAYGSVLSPAQIGALVDFLLGVRDDKLPQADALFTLDEHAPGYYRLEQGGEPSRGHALIEKTCARCHGKDGTNIAIDEGKHSLGTFLRTQASVAWLKILVGQPGSTMGPQLDKDAAPSELVSQLRDVLAAGCDRTRYPRGKATEADVPDGDTRCGAYLK